MRKTIVLMLVAGLVLFLAGCGDGDGAKKAEPKVKPENLSGFDKALADLDVSKAPVLGERFKRFYSFLYNGQWGESWEMMSKGQQENFTKEWKNMIAESEKLSPEQADKMIKDFTKDYEKEKNKPNPDADSLAKKRLSVGLATEMKNKFAGIESDKDYFIFTMGYMKEMVRSKTEKQFLEEGVEITGEEIASDGKSGYVITKSKETGQEKKKRFVREDGVWKIDFGG